MNDTPPTPLEKAYENVSSDYPSQLGAYSFVPPMLLSRAMIAAQLHDLADKIAQGTEPFSYDSVVVVLASSEHSAVRVESAADTPQAEDRVLAALTRAATRMALEMP